MLLIYLIIIISIYLLSIFITPLIISSYIHHTSVPIFIIITQYNMQTKVMLYHLNLILLLSLSLLIHSMISHLIDPLIMSIFSSNHSIISITSLIYPHISSYLTYSSITTTLYHPLSLIMISTILSTYPSYLYSTITRHNPSVMYLLFATMALIFSTISSCY